MSLAAPDFAVELDRFLSLVDRRNTLVCQGVAVTLANEVISGGQYSPGTPIDTGFARANWAAALDDEPPAPSVEAGPNLSGLAASAAAAINGVALQAHPGTVLTLQNTAPYIRHLEYGTSRMAPRAFIRQAIQAAPLIAKEVVAHVRSREA